MTTPFLKSGCLHTDPHSHLLDHIAPLAFLLDIPLIITELKNVELTQYYYPQTQIEYIPDLEYRLGTLAERFDALFETKYWLPQLKMTFKKFYHKEMQLIFCPHGQSDKGLNAPLLAPFGTQDAVLLYGDLLIEMLKTTNVWPSITRYALVGNYRLTYYLQNRQFMDDLVKKHIFSHLPQQPTLLYAPTWQDADESSSFFNEMFDLLRNLPSHWNLIIKPHPRLEEKTPAQFHKLLNYAEKHTNALIVTDFPFVYPILAQSNAYLGDFSSVGYDFLYFQKPMFFFSHPILKPGRLQTCGLLLENNKNPFSYIENHMINSFAKEQRNLYDFAFRPSESLKEKLLLTTQGWQDK